MESPAKRARCTASLNMCGIAKRLAPRILSIISADQIDGLEAVIRSNGYDALQRNIHVSCEGTAMVTVWGTTVWGTTVWRRRRCGGKPVEV